MRVFLSIDVDAATGETWVLRDGRKSHRLEKDHIDALMAEAGKGLWHDNAVAGQRFGERLYALLDGDGLLADLRRQQRETGKSLTLYLQLPEAWRHLPFEILHDGHAFFAQEAGCHLIRQVTDQNRYREEALEQRPMSLLFMACSPEKAKPVLHFEAEEEAITRAIESEKLPLEVTVEDSGSLDGLKTMLKDLGPFDILHLSGHAKLEKDGPVFFMETETSALDKVSPDRLWESLKNRNLKLVFLSGCETGKTDAQATTSFADALVAKGVPMVIGWGLPVKDFGATRFAMALYRLLGEGLALDIAVNQARQKLAGDYRTWSLLRVFCDGTPLNALADPKRKVIPRPKREQTYHFLQKSQVKVLAHGFVGRRRQLQLGLRVLRGYVADSNGLLITGTAGVGKSTLTGKLLERTTQKEQIIFPGRISEGEVVAKLIPFFDRHGHGKAVAAMQADTPFEARIKALFRDGFQQTPTLIVFDDFEQNLVQVGDRHKLDEGPRQVLLPFLEVLGWANGETQILITCRYPFTLVRNGVDLIGSQLQHIPLKGLEGADLRKKRRMLANMDQSAHKQAFEDASGGNPRLMEWLEALAEHVKDLDPEKLAKTLANQSETFVQEYLADMLAAAQDEAFQTFLAKASVYRTAVPTEAYAEFGKHAQLDKAVALTLMEREDKAEVPHYWVLPMIRQRFLAKLKDPKSAHAIAYNWYDAQTTNKDWHFEERIECIHHGAQAFEMKGCWAHAKDLTLYYYKLCLYREGVSTLSPLAPYIDETSVVSKLKQGESEAVDFLNNLGYLLRAQGDLAGAKPYYEQALAIRKQVLGEAHPDTAQSLNNLGYLLQAQGDLAGAKPYYEQALAINRQVLGEAHPNTAQSLNNLGYLLQAQGDLAGAKPYYEQALAIRKQLLGEAHPDTANSLNNLGALLQAQGDLAGAKPYYEQALAIWRKVLGEQHPHTQIALRNLAALSDAIEKDGDKSLPTEA